MGPKGKIVAAVGEVFISPHNHILSNAILLTKSYSNNVAEYNALLIGLQLARQMGVQYLKAYGDSKLIVSQIKIEYEVRHRDLMPYYQAAIKLAKIFDSFYISNVSRLQKTKADALTELAAMLALLANTRNRLNVATCQLFCSKYSLEVNKVHTTSANFEPRD